VPRPEHYGLNLLGASSGEPNAGWTDRSSALQMGPGLLGKLLHKNFKLFRAKSLSVKDSCPPDTRLEANAGKKWKLQACALQLPRETGSEAWLINTVSCWCFLAPFLTVELVLQHCLNKSAGYYMLLND